MNNEKPIPQLTLCVVNYNGEQYIEETLNSVFLQENKFKEILLIDNASEDSSIEIIKTKFPAVRIIHLEKNYGPGSARNEGFKAASYNRILFIDNDVNITPNLPDMLINALNKNPNASVAVPQVFFANQKNKIQYTGADSHFLGLMSLRNGIITSTGLKNGISEMGSLVTACFLVDRGKWGNGKPFDDSFFFNYEDHDFGLRTRIKGDDILSVSSANCYHGEGTLGLSHREGGKYSKTRVYCLIRNRWQIILKNYQLKTIFLLFPVFSMYEIFQLAGVIKKGWFIEWLKAVFWIVFNSKQILRKRLIVQRSRRIPDREILVGGPIPFFSDLLGNRLEKFGKNLLDLFTGFYWDKIKGFI